ncbi:Aste57867_8060 [Aphanomyces stellatus]|uniref:Aste57867_5400 protein n=1 Tax=Aphanomyces stellatus TaxID=120398 RepID=A0A485KHD8_9STRA|nr:hypothetical protein As57867_008030 [Aphanomyces stellatus]KAF0703381.1 hypothetical protein As57867_007619 [Aphanomyces stellatus]KAF0711085.1 hypothetical protein As57867_005387 [Aphanomyces stellatus]VFT82457.1 Aste57867_5400 [Aphanomyces stellatus]VFT84553.1 Aste57867_7647 [Aphanomyces stellatus]
MKYLTIEKRLRYATLYKSNALTVDDIARETNATPSTIYGWINAIDKWNQYVLQGLGGLTRIPSARRTGLGNNSSEVDDLPLTKEAVEVVQWMLGKCDEEVTMKQVVEQCMCIPGFAVRTRQAQYKCARRFVANHGLERYVLFKRSRASKKKSLHEQQTNTDVLSMQITNFAPLELGQQDLNNELNSPHLLGHCGSPLHSFDPHTDDFTPVPIDHAFTPPRHPLYEVTSPLAIILTPPPQNQISPPINASTSAHTPLDNTTIASPIHVRLCHQDLPQCRRNVEDEEIAAAMASFHFTSTNLYLNEDPRTEERELVKRPRKKLTRSCECIDLPNQKKEFTCKTIHCRNFAQRKVCPPTCPLGSDCSNQKFDECSQEVAHAIVKTSGKGFGVRVTHEVPEGKFLFEYVGEVIDVEEKTRRAEKIRLEGSSSYYFFALKGVEKVRKTTKTSRKVQPILLFVDASAFGNHSRFINHSCSPNAEAEVWVKDGFFRVLIISKRKILPNEEVTFNYAWWSTFQPDNFDCKCGASNCRRQAPSNVAPSTSSEESSSDENGSSEEFSP